MARKMPIIAPKMPPEENHRSRLSSLLPPPPGLSFISAAPLPACLPLSVARLVSKVWTLLPFRGTFTEAFSLIIVRATSPKPKPKSAT